MQIIADHPILGPLPEQNIVEIIVDGKRMNVRDGEMIAAVLMEAGYKKFRNTARTGEPRFYYCGIGQCTDCMMEVDGVPGIRTCITPVKRGMTVNSISGLGSWRDKLAND
jgi:predicted molibdopterin-dependent oxidoreductase YjgC